MPQALTRDYLSILIALQEKPLASIEELAKVVGTSANVVSKRISELQGIVPEEQRPKELRSGKYFVVKPVLNYWSLGRDIVDVMLETKNLLGVMRLEEIATKHPYTVYRARCYGHRNGVFLQFRTPFGTAELIEELVQNLVDEGSVSRYEFLPRGDVPSVFTPMSLEGWDPESMTWRFDWEKWFMSEPNDPPFRLFDRGEQSSALTWLTYNDVHIIRELQRGARRTNIAIIEALKKESIEYTPETFKQRYALIRKDCIADYRVSLYPDAFDIHNNVLIIGEGDPEHISKLRAQLIANPIPFDSVFRTEGRKLFWFIRIQPSHLSNLMSKLYADLDVMHVSLIDYKHTLLYYLWPDTLDENLHQWRTDRKFMIDDVMAE